MHVSGEGEFTPPHEIFLRISYSYTTLSRKALKKCYYVPDKGNLMLFELVFHSLA